MIDEPCGLYGERGQENQSQDARLTTRMRKGPAYPATNLTTQTPLAWGGYPHNCAHYSTWTALPSSRREGFFWAFAKVYLPCCMQD